MAEDAQNAGTVETKADFQKSPLKFTEHWLQAIELAGEEEKDWRTQAADTLKRYRRTKLKEFNILYANTQTTVPALYNSEPVPDIRRRFGDDDPVGKTASDMLERLLSIQNELYDFDGTMKAAVKDRQLQGRGVSRVRVKVGASKSVCDEPVIWDDFRIGPAKTWPDVPWIAFRHRMTREELVKLSPKYGKEVNLDAMVEGAENKNKDGSELAEMFKRALVWEVWDKTEREVYWFAESFKDGPLHVADDPYKLRDFFCVPRPLYAIDSTDTLKPVCEFMIWKPLADEMDGLTKRIAGIVAVMKLRGLYAGQFEGLISRLSNLDDGELAAAEDAARAMQQGGLKDAIWMWPVDMAITVVQGLYEAREQAKAALYEMTGVADILRGQTDPNETLGAQQIKAQWGSLRLQAGQNEVQRYARDILRMKADLSCQEMDFAEMVAMTGIKFLKPPEEPAQAPQMGHNGGPPMDAPQDPQAAAMAQQQAQLAQQQAEAQAQAEAQQMQQAVEALLKGDDLQREFIIEIETDSTIRADLSRAQQNVSGFVTGLGEFMQGVGPAVQAGFMPPEIAVKYIGVFSRNFKLGREAELLTDEWVKALEKKAKEPPPPDPEQQKAQLEMQQMQVEAQAKQADRAAELQAKQQEHQMDLQMRQAELAMKEKELALKEREMGLKMQAQEQQMALDAQGAQAEHQFKMTAMQEQAQFDSQERASNAEHEDERRSSEIAFMKQKQAAQPKNGAAT